MLNIEGYPAQISAFAIATGLLWLRWTRPQLPRPFKASIPMVVVYSQFALHKSSRHFCRHLPLRPVYGRGSMLWWGWQCEQLQFFYLTSNLSFDLNYTTS